MEQESAKMLDSMRPVMQKENISRKGSKDLSQRAVSWDTEVKASSGRPLQSSLIKPSRSICRKQRYSNSSSLTAKRGENWLVGVGISTANEAASGKPLFCTLLHVHTSSSQS